VTIGALQAVTIRLCQPVTIRLSLDLGTVVWDRCRRRRRTEGARKLRALHTAAGRLHESIAAEGGSIQPAG
jgi:hypothetical protein